MSKWPLLQKTLLCRRVCSEGFLLYLVHLAKKSVGGSRMTVAAVDTASRRDFSRPLASDVVSSPVGDVVLVVHDGVLLALDFEDCRDRMLKLLGKRFERVRLVNVSNPAGVSDLVRRYFAGELSALESLPMETGGTDFQRQVWQGLRKISPGAVMTYGELAVAMNNPKAVRTVGMANSLNPIVIALHTRLTQHPVQLSTLISFQIQSHIRKAKSPKRLN